MGILDRFEAQAIENVATGSEFRETIFSLFGYAEVNYATGYNVNSSSVEFEVDYEIGPRDEELLIQLIREDPEVDSLEKAIRSGNEALADELAESIFKSSFEEIKVHLKNKVNQMSSRLEQRFNELVNDQEVYLMGFNSTSMTLFELYGERDYDEVYVRIYQGWDTTYFYDRKGYVIDLISDDLRKKGLLED